MIIIVNQCFVIKKMINVNHNLYKTVKYYIIHNVKCAKSVINSAMLNIKKICPHTILFVIDKGLDKGINEARRNMIFLYFCVIK